MFGAQQYRIATPPDVLSKIMSANIASRLCRRVKLHVLVGLLLTAFTGVLSTSIASEALPRCLYISSYHNGYAWSDGVEEGLRSVLNGKCDIRQYDMDTKRKRSAEDIQLAVAESQRIIESWKPDVVITSDDNAAKYLIVPHYKNSSLPYVFSGINWTVEEYGFPVSNITGIVEVAPIEPMLKEAMQLSNGRKGIYIGADTLTERKNFKRILSGAENLSSSLSQVFVGTAEDWKSAFRDAQAFDYIVVGSNSGIVGWDDADISDFALQHSKTVSVTNHEWMMPVTALGYTKIPQEHGEWAASAALEILSGANPIDIPVVTNRRWDLWLNQGVVDTIGTELSTRFIRRAKRYVEYDN